MRHAGSGAVIRAGAVGLAVLVGMASCFPRARADLRSDSPRERLLGIRKAASEGDTGAVPDLIERLHASDPAERLYAIAALERITGERHGYDPSSSEVEREAAIDRWVAWAEAAGLGAGRARPGAASRSP